MSSCVPEGLLDVSFNAVLTPLFDAKIDTVAVGGLPSSGVSRVSIGLIAPSRPGIWYYRICVDCVDGESDEDTDDNCSDVVEVKLPGSIEKGH